MQSIFRSEPTPATCAASRTKSVRRLTQGSTEWFEDFEIRNKVGLANLTHEPSSQSIWAEFEEYLQAVTLVLFKESTLPTKTLQSRLAYLYKESDLISNLDRFVSVAVSSPNCEALHERHATGLVSHLIRLVILTTHVKDKALLSRFRHVVHAIELVLPKTPASIQFIFMTIVLNLVQEESRRRLARHLLTPSFCSVLIKCLAFVSERVKTRQDHFALFYYNVAPSLVQLVFGIELKGDHVFAKKACKHFQNHYQSFQLGFQEKAKRSVREIKISKRLKSAQKNENALEAKKKENLPSPAAPGPVDIFEQTNFERSFYIFVFLFEGYRVEGFQDSHFRRKQTVKGKNLFEQALALRPGASASNGASPTGQSKLLLSLAYDFYYRPELIELFVQFIQVDIEKSLNRPIPKLLEFDIFRSISLKHIIFLIFFLRLLETHLYSAVERLNQAGRSAHGRFLILQLVAPNRSSKSSTSSV